MRHHSTFALLPAAGGDAAGVTETHLNNRHGTGLTPGLMKKF
ncbi:hypothetical protein JAB8_52260 [Janthinobacterium sp. HH106]|nr:hypothetical protein JAB8_52260 [Janthinobacterium sp. HH106]